MPCWSGWIQTPNFTLGIILNKLFFESVASMTSSINLQDCYNVQSCLMSLLLHGDDNEINLFYCYKCPFLPRLTNFLHGYISARPMTFRNSENVMGYVLTVIMMTWLIRRVGPSWTIISVPDLVEQSTEGVRCQQVHYSKKALSQLQILLSHNFHHSLQPDSTN